MCHVSCRSCRSYRKNHSVSQNSKHHPHANPNDREKNIPPIIIAIRLFQHGNDIPLLEAQVTRLLGLKGIKRNSLVLLHQRRLALEVRLGRRRPPRPNLPFFGVLLTRVLARHRDVLQRARPRPGPELPRAVVDVVLPRGRPLGCAERVPAVGGRRARSAAVHAVSAGVVRHPLAVRAAPLPVPHHVVVAVVVDGDVVVHAAVVEVARAGARERARVEDVEQRRRLGRLPLGALQQLLGTDGPAVELGVRVLALYYRGPLQADAREQALRLAVAEYARDAPEAGGARRLGVAAHGPRCDRDITAEGEGSRLREGLHGRGVVEDEDEVGQLEADLAAEAGAAGRDR